MPVIESCRHPDGDETGMLDHGRRPVEVEHCGDGEGWDAGPGPHERVLAVEVESDGLPAGGQVDAAAHKLLPPPAVESLVTEAGDDPVVRHEPRSNVRRESGWRAGANRPVGREGERSLDQDSFVGVDHDADMERAHGCFQ